MILLGISGGPDSMFLLYQYRNRKDIVVATVNYNVRSDSSHDVEIVRAFCDKHNIKFELLEIDKSIKHDGNFEAWARKQRYLFFKQIYKKYNCSKLLLAHQKDDFLETAIMQDQSKREPLYYGIKEQNYLYSMHIGRPLLSQYFKSEIIDFLKVNNINYAVDSTNELPIYTRNKIRLSLLTKTTAQKDEMIKNYKLKNQELLVREKQINEEYTRWKNNKFSQDYFDNLLFKKEIIFKLIHVYFDDVELSSRKIESIKDFVLSTNRTSKFLLKKDVYLIKEHGCLKLLENWVLYI